MPLASAAEAAGATGSNSTVWYGERSERWSWWVRASVSTSWSTTQRAPYFPTDSGMQDRAQTQTPADAFYDGDSSRGAGRSLALSSEYQVTAHTFFGGLIELERSPDYSPNRFVVYLRHAWDRPASRPVFFPPLPMVPTSQY